MVVAATFVVGVSQTLWTECECDGRHLHRHRHRHRHHSTEAVAAAFPTDSVRAEWLGPNTKHMGWASHHHHHHRRLRCHQQTQMTAAAKKTASLRLSPSYSTTKSNITHQPNFKKKQKGRDTSSRNQKNRVMQLANFPMHTSRTKIAPLQKSLEKLSSQVVLCCAWVVSVADLIRNWLRVWCGMVRCSLYKQMERRRRVTSAVEYERWETDFELDEALKPISQKVDPNV